MSWLISCGFKNLDKLGVRIKKSKTPPWYDFLKISLKVTYLQKKSPVNFTGNSFVNFKGISFYKIEGDFNLKGFLIKKIKNTL